MKKIPLVPDDAKRLFGQLRLLADPEPAPIQSPNNHKQDEIVSFPYDFPVMPRSHNVSEYQILERLQPIETMLQRIADASLEQLKLESEFIKSSESSSVNGTYTIHDASSTQYSFNPKGRVVKLLNHFGEISDIIKRLPVSYLPLNVQSLHLAFRVEKFTKVVYSETYKRDVISQITPAYKNYLLEMYSPTVVCAYRSVTTYNPEGMHINFSYRNPYLQSDFLLDRKQASEYLKRFNARYLILLGLLKNRKIYLHLRDRHSASFGHYNRIRDLFKNSTSKHVRVSMIYLELQHYSSVQDEPELIELAYKNINQTRERLFKDRSRNPLFRNLIGYAWKYRYSHPVGIVCSMVLLFDDKNKIPPDDLSHLLARHIKFYTPKHCSQAQPIPIHPRVNIRVAYDRYMMTEEKETQDIFESLARLMGLYDIYIKPEPPKKFRVFGASVIKSEARKPRALTRYTNPYTREVVECKSSNNKKLKEWISLYGDKDVLSWGEKVPAKKLQTKR